MKYCISPVSQGFPSIAMPFNQASINIECCIFSCILSNIIRESSLISSSYLFVCLISGLIH